MVFPLRRIGFCSILPTPDHAIQPGNPLTCQAHQQLITHGEIQTSPACNGAHIHPPHQLVIQLYRLKLCDNRNLTATPYRKVNTVHLRDLRHRLVFPCCHPGSLCGLPVRARGLFSLPDHNAISRKG